MALLKILQSHISVYFTNDSLFYSVQTFPGWKPGTAWVGFYPAVYGTGKGGGSTGCVVEKTFAYYFQL